MINMIKDVVEKMIRNDKVITSEALADLFPALFGEVLISGPHLEFKDAETCMRFINDWLDRNDITLPVYIPNSDDVKEPTTAEKLYCAEDVRELKKAYNLVSNLSYDESKTPTGFDPIGNPSHYTEGRKYEPRKVIYDWGLNFNLGNAVKYIARAGRKDPEKTVEDLKKAIQYIKFELDEMNAKVSSWDTNKSDMEARRAEIDELKKKLSATTVEHEKAKKTLNRAYGIQNFQPNPYYDNATHRCCCNTDYTPNRYFEGIAQSCCDSDHNA